MVKERSKVKTQYKGANDYKTLYIENKLASSPPVAANGGNSFFLKRIVRAEALRSPLDQHLWDRHQ